MPRPPKGHCPEGHDLSVHGRQRTRPDGRLNGVTCRKCDAADRKQKRWNKAFDVALAEHAAEHPSLVA